jgi:hypothetical protein
MHHLDIFYPCGMLMLGVVLFLQARMAKQLAAKSGEEGRRLLFSLLDDRAVPARHKQSFPQSRLRLAWNLARVLAIICLIAWAIQKIVFL